MSADPKDRSGKDDNWMNTPEAAKEFGVDLEEDDDLEESDGDTEVGTDEGESSS